MFSGSQFDATNALSGGGFMASQSTQFGDSTPSPAKRRKTHGLVPVMVKQISEAHQSGYEKSNFVINGADVAMPMPVKNFDEVTFHFIECIHTHLQMSKLQLQGNAATQTRPMNSSLNTPVGSRSTGYQTAPSNQFSGQFSVHGLKSCDQLVLDYLQQPSSM
ncbi:hypothetical protein C1H46_039983 [Malus baccata]|uniref:Uncharacterized protein n=1 Tax=Malus baccata TaxID=106549 RepID=A0A540KJT5_MALBA|nr:hypothetical protein C1H46_039983 [Malus baccata]